MADELKALTRLTFEELGLAAGGIGSPGVHASARAAMWLRRSRYAGSHAPGWSLASSTVTEPSSFSVTGE